MTNATANQIDLETIKTKIKEIVHQTTNIDPAKIGDTMLFVEELKIDSLTMLEVAVNIDQEWNLFLPEEELEQLKNVQVSAEKVHEALQARGDGA